MRNHAYYAEKIREKFIEENNSSGEYVYYDYADFEAWLKEKEGETE